MKCSVCREDNIPREKNTTVCSDKCLAIHNKANELDKKYFPTNGCDNCWGDLHRGCSETCRREFKESLQFGKDLWSLIRIFYPLEKELG